jgi:phage tail sheath protein FI
LIAIENNSEAILNNFIFQGNSRRNRERVTSLLNSYMQTVLAGEGVDSYRVICDDSNNTTATINQNILNVDIWVQPTKTIEFIKLRVVITSDSVSVNEGA